MTTENPSTLIFLVNDQVRAIAASYDKIDMDKDTTKMKYVPPYLSNGSNMPKEARVYKTMDPNIKVDDYVCVPTETRHGMTVVKVVAVDVDVDYDSDKECHWIIASVNTHGFEQLRQMEDKMIGAVKKAQVGKRRRELAKTLQSSIDPDAIKGIPMFTSGVTVEQPPSQPSDSNVMAESDEEEAR